MSAGKIVLAVSLVVTGISACHQGAFYGSGTPCSDTSACRSPFTCVAGICQLATSPPPDAGPDVVAQADGPAQSMNDLTSAGGEPDVDQDDHGDADADTAGVADSPPEIGADLPGEPDVAVEAGSNDAEAGSNDAEAGSNDAPIDIATDTSTADETAFDAPEEPEAARPPQIIEYRVPTAGSAPNDLVLGADGAIWFTEGSADKIGKLTPRGVFNEFSTPGKNVFVDRLAHGRNGDLWFSESFGSKIGKITSAGTILELDIAPDQPDGIAMGADGSIWYGGGAKVSKLNPDDGSVVGYSGFGAAGAMAASPDGYIWVCDLRADRIVRVSANGELRPFPAGASHSSPIGLVIDGDHLWFAEYFGNQIGRMAITENGPVPIGTLQEFPIPTLQSLPVGVAVDTHGNVWFTENATSAVGRMSPTGAMTEFSLPTPGSKPVEIVGSPDGTLWFTESGANRIGHLIP